MTEETGIQDPWEKDETVTQGGQADGACSVQRPTNKQTSWEDQGVKPADL